MSAKSSHDLFFILKCSAHRKRRVHKLGVKEQLQKVEAEAEAEAEVPLQRGGEKQILLPSKV